MTWREVGSDGEMIQHAIDRKFVRLRDGRIARLVAWPGGKRTHRGRYCRCETRAGTRFTIRCDAVEAMEDDDVPAV